MRSGASRLCAVKLAIFGLRPETTAHLCVIDRPDMKYLTPIGRPFWSAGTTTNGRRPRFGCSGCWLFRRRFGCTQKKRCGARQASLPAALQRAHLRFIDLHSIFPLPVARAGQRPLQKPNRPGIEPTRPANDQQPARSPPGPTAKPSRPPAVRRTCIPAVALEFA